METPLFSPPAAIEAQEKYCAENQLPQFAPRDGVCHRCTNNIYKPKGVAGRETGISVDEASKTHVLDCPHCRISYCN